MNQEDLQYLTMVIAQLHVSIGRMEKTLQAKEEEITKLKSINKPVDSSSKPVLVDNKKK